MNRRSLRASSLVIAFLLLSVHARAEVSSDGLWRDITGVPQPESLGERVLFPKRFRTFALDVAAFERVAAGAPMELSARATDAPTIITLPMPDGSFARFRLEQSPMIDAELARQLPKVSTWRAFGVDDPTAYGRVDFTPQGFHGYLLTESGNVYIDPYSRGDVARYMSYWRSDYERADGSSPFACDVHDDGPVTPSDAGAGAAASGAVLRTYRLALACTGEYAAYHGGTVSAAQTAMITSMNRVNAVYEKEVAVRMTMVANSAIIFTSSATDPYANTSGDLNANQSTIDATIGAANYDIGHLFGTGGGGVAQLGCVCAAGSKARGLTGSSAPVGDAFDIDYVAHEIGHQFGGPHTFNGTTGNCSGNRSASSAYEPGSGTTIMAYAGICGAEDLQPNSDPYFHTRSFDQIVAFTTTGGGNACAAQTSTGNGVPTVSAGSAITIPRATPFYLTGSAADPNGEALTYNWEEFDLGTASPPNTDDGTRPIFRSFNASSSPTRTFPKLSDLLNNVSTFGESLPSFTRTMTFRLTVRDPRGGVNAASRTVSVSSAAGPFLVTAPNTAVSWTGGSAQSVTWSVASTNLSPVSCASVKIQLSTDGGNSWPTTLLASTPNDGTETVTVPTVTSAAARIRVECTTSPFFDVSNVNFSIATSIVVTAAATTPTNVAVSWTAVAGAASYQIHRRAAGGTFVEIGTSISASFNDTAAAANSAYLYAIKSVDGAGVVSALSSSDLAATVLFTDPALVAGSTYVKGAHVTELRTAVNAVRSLAALGAYAFTDPTLTTATRAKAVHLTDLRSALNAARSALALPTLTYTDATPAAVKAVQITELRNGVK